MLARARELGHGWLGYTWLSLEVIHLGWPVISLIEWMTYLLHSNWVVVVITTSQ